jgi:cell division transport system ATP-binding protein
VLHDLDLRLDAGSFHFLVGPSGAGKASLLRLVSLCHPPTRGTIVLFGRDVSRLDRAERTAVRQRLGVMFQEFRLLENLSAFDNVALPLRLGGTREEQIATQVCEMLGWLGLGTVLERRPADLSTGQRQLIAAARAVITRPALLLADEPTSSIDPACARRLMELFLSLHRTGTTVVLATHNELLVRSHPFPLLELADGRLSGPGPRPALAMTG